MSTDFNSMVFAFTGFLSQFSYVHGSFLASFALEMLPKRSSSNIGMELLFLQNPVLGFYYVYIDKNLL